MALGRGAFLHLPLCLRVQTTHFRLPLLLSKSFILYVCLHEHVAKCFQLLGIWRGRGQMDTCRSSSTLSPHQCTAICAARCGETGHIGSWQLGISGLVWEASVREASASPTFPITKPLPSFQLGLLEMFHSAALSIRC